MVDRLCNAFVGDVAGTQVALDEVSHGAALDELGQNQALLRQRLNT